MHLFSKHLYAISLIFVVSLIWSLPASGEEEQEPTKGNDVIRVDDGSGIIPKPGSGSAPSSPTDRGGAFQLGLLVLLLLFPVVAIVSIRRQAKKKKQVIPS